MVGVGGCPGQCWFHGSCFLLTGACKCSAFCFDGGDHFRLEWKSSNDDCSCTLHSCPSTSGSIGVDYVISLIRSDGGEAALAYLIGVTSLAVMAIPPSWEKLCCHGGDGKWMMFCLRWRSGCRRVESSSAFRRKLEWFWGRCGMLASRATCLGWSSVLGSVRFL